MKIFGAIGLNGSGKDEVVKYLQREYNVSFVSVGDIVREIAREKGVSPTRENLHKISEERIRKFGKEHFMSLIVEGIEKNGWRTAGITGIRTPEDVHYLKNRFNGDFVLLHVFVGDASIRYERTHKRAKARDPQTYHAFLEQDREEEKMFNIDKASSMADYFLDNSKSLENLHRQIDDIIEIGNFGLEKVKNQRCR